MTGSDRDEIAKLQALYSANPEGRIFTHLAEAYRKAGDLGAARDLVERGLKQHGDYSSAHVVLGRILLDQRETSAAETAFRRVLTIDPENRVALRALADLAREAGRHAEAVEYYREVLLLDPGDDAAEALLLSIDMEPAAADSPAPAPTSPAGEADLVPPAFGAGDDRPEPLDLEADFEPLDLETGFEPLDLETAFEPLDLEMAEMPLELDESSEPLDPETTFESLDLETDFETPGGEAAFEPLDLEAAFEPLDLETTPDPLDLETIPEPLDLETFGLSIPDSADDLSPDADFGPITDSSREGGTTAWEELDPLDLTVPAAAAESLVEEVSALAGESITEEEFRLDEVESIIDGESPADLKSPGEEEFSAGEEPPLTMESTADFAVAMAAPVDSEPPMNDDSVDFDPLPILEEWPGVEESVQPERAGGAAELDRGDPDGIEEPMTVSRDEAGGMLDAEALTVMEEERYDLGLVVTETMADLYASQGLTAQAAEVYRELIRERPEDPGLQRKLASLSHGGAPDLPPPSGAEVDAPEEPVGLLEEPLEELLVSPVEESRESPVEEPLEDSLEELLASPLEVPLENPQEASALDAAMPIQGSGRAIGEYLSALLAFGRDAAAGSIGSPDGLAGDDMAAPESERILLLDESMVVEEAPDLPLLDPSASFAKPILLDETMVVHEDEVGAAAGPLHQAAPTVAPTRYAEPEAAPLADEEDDLEVFRTWLRNLNR